MILIMASHVNLLFFCCLLAKLSFSYDFAKFDQFFNNKIKKGQLVGAAVAVVEKDKVAYMNAYGLRKKGSGQKVDKETIFQLGSVSKPITASAFNKIEQLKLVSLDTKIEIINANVGQALSHTSGFLRHPFNKWIEQGKSKNELISLLLTRNQKEPGKHFDYHNTVYSLVEDVLFKALKMPFDQILQKHLFGPVGMGNASVGIKKFIAETNKAWPHEKGKKGVFASSSYSNRYHEVVPASAGVNANIKDMAEFLKYLIREKDMQPYYQPVIKSPDAESWYRRRLKEDFACHYGHGFRLLSQKDKKLVFHGGFLKGFNNFLVFSEKEQKGFVVLQNTENTSVFPLMQQFFALK